MNVAKHIFTLVMGVSIGAMAQTETALDSLAATAVPDSVPLQPVAENVEVAPVENAPADSAVVDSTVQSAEVVPEAAPEAVADTTANTIEALWADESAKPEQTETAVVLDTAKPVVDSVAPVYIIPVAEPPAAEVTDLGWEAKQVPVADTAKTEKNSLSKVLHGNA